MIDDRLARQVQIEESAWAAQEVDRMFDEYMKDQRQMMSEQGADFEDGRGGQSEPDYRDLARRLAEALQPFASFWYGAFDQSDLPDYAIIMQDEDDEGRSREILMGEIHAALNMIDEARAAGVLADVTQDSAG